MKPLQYRDAFRARVLQLQREQFGGNFEEALMAAVGDEFEVRDAGALVVKKGALDITDEEREELRAGTAVVTEEPPEPEPPKKKRGRPRKAKT